VLQQLQAARSTISTVNVSINMEYPRTNKRNRYLSNSFRGVFSLQFWVYALFHFIFTQSWSSLQKIPRQQDHQCQMQMLSRGIGLSRSTDPCDKTLLSSRHGVVNRFSSSKKLKKNNTKTIDITFLSQLPSHCISVMFGNTEDKNR